MSIVRPKPLQLSQAPTGWLNEKSPARDRRSRGRTRRSAGLAEAARLGRALDVDGATSPGRPQRRLERVDEPPGDRRRDRHAVEHDAQHAALGFSCASSTPPAAGLQHPPQAGLASSSRTPPAGALRPTRGGK